MRKPNISGHAGPVADHPGARRSAQAMIEFVFAILLVVIIVAGMLQFVELAGKKGELLAEIRCEAGEQALGNRQHMFDAPEYILNWNTNADMIRHTADDTAETAPASGTLQASVLDRSVLHPNDWRYLDASRNRTIPDLQASLLPMADLGFVHAELREQVLLLPAMRDWLIGKDAITVGAELWFPRLVLDGFEP